MRERKWTPLPWRFERNGCIVLPGDLPPNTNKRVCIVSGGYKDSERLEADGHLIAAAPDLYEALEGLVAKDDPHAAFNPSPEIHAARAALAKARGDNG